jgi:hypothetical protein
MGVVELSAAVLLLAVLDVLDVLLVAARRRALARTRGR